MCFCGCGAWHAVGFWGGAPWAEHPLLKKIVWGGVGGLVVNCIVDASIYNM